METRVSLKYFVSYCGLVRDQKENKKYSMGSNKLILFLVNLPQALGRFMPRSTYISCEYIPPQNIVYREA